MKYSKRTIEADLAKATNRAEETVAIVSGRITKFQAESVKAVDKEKLNFFANEAS